MYAAVYARPEGFGSVGFLAGFRGQSIRVGDPIFGYVTVAAEDCFCVISTETGVVLPAVTPVLADSIESSWLMPTEGQMVANEVTSFWVTPTKGGDKFPSGYPAAWERVKRWREHVAPDWRTIVLVAAFARSTIRTNIKTAEKSYRAFGPWLREAVLSGRKIVPSQIARLRPVRAMGLATERAEDYVALLDYAPWLEDQMRRSSDYTRGFRNEVALQKMPPGIALPKLSFTVSLLGRDAACLDGRILGDWFGDESKQIAKGFEKPGGMEHVRRTALDRYIALEDRLRETEYWDPEWPMPYAKAQWMLWEASGRTPGPADHSALWDVIDPLVKSVS